MADTEVWQSPRDRGGSTSQTATRLLIILDVLGTPASDSDVESAVKVVSSLTRLEKLDFWLRNPDYLADELLTELEEGRLPFDVVEQQVSRMLDQQAPSLHRYPMARYLYGAYERIDDALALLKTYRQIAHRRVADTGVRSRRDYFLLEKGRDSLAAMRVDIPALAWYDEQAAAIGLIGDAKIGATAKGRQYKQNEYRDTPIGAVIPPITERVAERAGRLGIAKIASTEGTSDSHV